MNLFYWHSDSESHTDRTNYPLFQSYEDIDPETEDSCGSAAINCLTQASHGRKFAHEKGPMLYNAINPTGGEVGVATTAARVFLGIASIGMSEAIISPTLHAIFSELKPILKRISAYSVTPGNTMNFLKETVIKSQNPVLILFDRGPNKFHWVCCCGYIEAELGSPIYICNDWGRCRLISHSTIDDWTSATLDNFIAVKSNKWAVCYSDRRQNTKIQCMGMEFDLAKIE